MLRSDFMDKYKQRGGKQNYYKNDHIDNSDKDLITPVRPLNPKDIRKLPKDKLHIFIDDFYKDESVNKVLFSTAAKIEIKIYNQEKESIERVNNVKPEKEIKTALELAKERKMAFLRNQEYLDEITKAKKKVSTMKEENQKDFDKEMDKNNRNFEIYRKEIKNQEKELEQRNFNNKVSTFKRVYENMKKRINDEDAYEENERYVQTEPNDSSVIALKTVETAHSTNLPKKKFLFPNCKLNIKDVYSRLYHNTVLYIPLKLSTKVKNDKKKSETRSKIIDNNQQDEYGDPQLHKTKKLNVQNVFKNSLGKEFTQRITHDMAKKCFLRYSGGHEGFKDYCQTESNNPGNKNVLNSFAINEYNILRYKDEKGNTFLHTAVNEGVFDIASHLIDKGINLNVQNKAGDTALHIALRKQYYDIADYMLESGASVLIFNNKGEMPFDRTPDNLKKKHDLDKLFVKVEELKLKRHEELKAQRNRELRMLKNEDSNFEEMKKNKTESVLPTIKKK